MAKTRASTKEMIERLALLEQGFKFCKNCGETKKVEEFAADKRHTDGLQTYCRNCQNELRRTKWGDKIKKRYKEYHQEHKESRNKRKREYMQERKDYFRPRNKAWNLANQEHNKAKAKARHATHKEEDNATARVRMKQWVKDNYERHKHNCHNRRIRKKNAQGSHTLKQWKELVKLCGGVCLVCGSSEDLTKDHIIPLIQGGTDNLDNLQLLCCSCNCSKQDLLIVDYRPLPARAWSYEQTYGTLDEGMVYDEQATLEWWVKLQVVGMGVEVR